MRGLQGDACYNPLYFQRDQQLKLFARFPSFFHVFPLLTSCLDQIMWYISFVFFLLKVTVLNCLPSPYWVHIALYLTVWFCGILRTVKPHQCSKRRENNSVLSNPQEFWVIFLSKYFLLFWSRENMAVCGGVSEQQQQRHQWIWTSISCCHLNKGHSIFIKHL